MPIVVGQNYDLVRYGIYEAGTIANPPVIRIENATVQVKAFWKNKTTNVVTPYTKPAFSQEKPWHDISGPLETPKNKLMYIEVTVNKLGYKEAKVVFNPTEDGPDKKGIFLIPNDVEQEPAGDELPADEDFSDAGEDDVPLPLENDKSSDLED